MRKTSLAIGVLLGAFAAASAQSLATWSKYKNITVNTKASGANVATDVTNFPVLVRLDATNANDVFTGAQPGGTDIRFAKANGTTVLAHEIEEWDAVAKRAAIWVLLDTVKGNDSVASFRLYWGRTGVASASNGAAVFDTAYGWSFVYHMNGGAGSKTEKDATVNGLHLSASDTVTAAIPGDTAGMVGRARVFAGDASTIAGRQYFVAANSANHPAVNRNTTQPHTLSAWAYARAISAENNHGNSVFNKGDKQFAMQIYGGTGSTSKLWESAVYTSTWRQAKSKQLAAAGGWYHITGTWSGGDSGTTGQGKLYINGVLDSTSSLQIGNANPGRTYNIFVGANPDGGGTNATAPGTPRDLAKMTNNLTRPRYWNGYLDELTHSRVVRSAEFVKLSYETQKENAKAVTLGATQTQTVTPTAISNVRYVMPGSGNTPRDTLVFTAGVPVDLPLLYDGGPADSAALTGNPATLPAGLTIDKATGRLSGTPLGAFAAANRTLTVYSSTGNVTRGLRISVVLGPLAGLAYATDSTSYAVGVAVSNVASWSSNGRAPTKFTVTPALPAGVKLDSITGVISGVPTATSALATYTIKATNATDTLSTTVKFSVVDGGAENYTTWSQRRTLWINTQSNGAAVAGNVANFPLLVRINASWFDAGFGQAKSDGSDIRFTKPNNTTRLQHHIERWDAAAKVAEVWVLLDTVKGSRLDSITMHWGKADAVNLSNGAAVFDTASGFRAVWHMNAANGNEADVTHSGFLAAAVNGPVSDSGVIGKSRKFDGASQYFAVPNSASGVLNFSQADKYTLSAWIKPLAISTGSNTGHKIIDKGDNQYVLATYGGSADSRYWEITIKANGTWNQCQADGNTGTAVLASSSIGSWHHLVGTYTGGPVGSDVVQHLYYDGVKVAECPISNSDAGGRTETFNVHLGVQAEGTAPGTAFSRYFNGYIDEPRLQSVARSYDWVKLEYANQRPTGQNLVYTTKPTTVRGALAGNAGYGLSFRSTGRGIAFRIQGEAAQASLVLLDVWGRTVWSGSFANGALQWDGRTASGSNAVSGIYLARVSVRDAEGKLLKVLDQRIPFTH